MRILHFCSVFSTLSETFIYDLIAGLERHGFDNHVVTFKRLRADSRPFSKVNVVKAAEPSRPEALARRVWGKVQMRDNTGICWPIEQRRIAPVVQSLKPDLIHAHFGPCGAKILPIAKAFDIPLVTTFHGYDATMLPRKPFWKSRLSHLCRSSEAVVGVSENICNKLRELGAPEHRVVKIANGIRLDQFPYQCPNDRFDGKRVEWLFVGRLVEKKGVLHLLESFRLAKAMIPPGLTPILHIVGEGCQMDALRAAHKRYGMGESVRIHGAQPHSFVQTILKRCHLFAQHSVTGVDGDQEGQPIGLIEAAASGLPIVATRHSGISEVVIDGKNGFLVAERDVETMAVRMAYLSTHPERWKAMSEWGRQHVERNMRLERQLDVWADLFERVVHGAPAMIPQSAPLPEPAAFQIAAN